MALLMPNSNGLSDTKVTFKDQDPSSKLGTANQGLKPQFSWTVAHSLSLDPLPLSARGFPVQRRGSFRNHTEKNEEKFFLASTKFPTSFTSTEIFTTWLNIKTLLKNKDRIPLNVTKNSFHWYTKELSYLQMQDGFKNLQERLHAEAESKIFQ